MIVTSKSTTHTEIQPTKRYKFVLNSILNAKIQTMLKRWIKQAKNSKKRIKILQQWIKTESDYIRDIKIITDKIQKPMLQYQLITPEQDRILFPNLEALLKLSTQMVTIVESFLSNWNPHTTLIAEKLINFHKSFIIYRQYYNNYYQAEKIRKQIKKRPQYPQFSKTISSLPMDMESYIIKPFQRPPKYQLLLRQYQKALNPNHSDYQLLTKAIEKYHNVNDQNNKSMDLQLRSQKMIQLDQKYGGIIANKRVYLFSEFAKTIDFNIKIYVFNDLIVVVRVHSYDREEGYKKIFLNYQSFVDIHMDGKYFINKLFICGTKQNLHLTFLSQSTRNRVFNNLKQIIHELYSKQTNKSIAKRKAKKKMSVMNIDNIQIRNKSVFRVTIAGVQKRPTLLNLIHQPYYILKIQTPYPNNVFQFSMIKFNDFVNLEQHIRNGYPLLQMPLLDSKPQNMSIYDAKKNKTQIIECRITYIQSFINFVLRSEQLQQYSELIAKTLKINEALWKLCSYIEPCSCSICSSMKRYNSFQQFEQQKSSIRMSLLYEIQENNSQNSLQLYPRCSLSSLISPVHCVFNNFMLKQKILSAQTTDLNTLQRRLQWLECKNGRIDYSFLPKTTTQKNIKITIELLSLKQDQHVNVSISCKSTVVEVLDDIAAKYKISTLRDFCLVIEYQSIPRILDRDQTLWEVLTEIQYQFQQQSLKSSTSSFLSGLSIESIKKWGQEIMNSKKSKIYLKKCIFMSNQLEIKACQMNPSRYSLLVWQIFYRFQNEHMTSSQLSNTTKLCALFYILNYIDRLPYLNQNTFQIDKLKILLPQSQLHLINNEHDSNTFHKEVFILIKQYEKQIQNTALPNTNKLTSSTSIISTKVQVIYYLILKLVMETMNWNTLFFDVTNYEPISLPGAYKNLLLGINQKYFIIVSHQQMKPLVQIQLSKLDYKISVMSIFIKTEEKQLRFDGPMMFTIKKIIENYQILTQKFGD